MRQATKFLDLDGKQIGEDVECFLPVQDGMKVQIQNLPGPYNVNYSELVVRANEAMLYVTVS